jgi:cold shock CspA family protein
VIQDEGFKILKEDQKVKYDKVQSPKGATADNVTSA